MHADYNPGFTPSPVEITAYDPEVTGLDLLHKTKFAKKRQVEPTPDLAHVSERTAKLDAVIAYVEEVLSGEGAAKEGNKIVFVMAKQSEIATKIH